MVVETGGEKGINVVKIFDFCVGIKAKNSFICKGLRKVADKFPQMFNDVMEYAGRVQYATDEQFLGDYWVAVFLDLRIKHPKAEEDLRQLCFKIKRCKPCSKTDCHLEKLAIN